MFDVLRVRCFTSTSALGVEGGALVEIQDAP